MPDDDYEEVIVGDCNRYPVVNKNSKEIEDLLQEIDFNMLWADIMGRYSGLGAPMK
jgi:hypothetical protein